MHTTYMHTYIHVQADYTYQTYAKEFSKYISDSQSEITQTVIQTAVCSVSGMYVTIVLGLGCMYVCRDGTTGFTTRGSVVLLLISHHLGQIGPTFLF